MKKGVLLASAVSLAVLSIAGCGKTQGSTADTVSVETAATIATEPETQEKGESEKTEAAPASSEGSHRQGKMNLNFKPGFNISGDEYKPLEIQARAPEYTLNADLSNVENLDQFSNLTQNQKNMIARNGFVVSPTDSEQLFYVYEENTYKKVPSFVTTDSVLQLYHIFYDYSLRSLESDYFYQDLIRLNDAMIKQLLLEYGSAEGAEIKEAILKMTGYFGVSGLALGQPLPQGFPEELKTSVQAEYELISAAAGKAESPLFDLELDYSLFKVRGHYTRSEELGKFFRAMSWYGIVPLPFYTMEGTEPKPDEVSAMRAIVATLALCRAPEEDGVKLWENIYSTTCFYVGESDDITPYEIAEVIQRVYSDTPDINKIPEKLDLFYEELEKLRTPDIVPKTPEAVKGLQLRFMGQRYIPDSEILQNLSQPLERPFPTGLDVFAVFGSERAEELLDEFYQPKRQWSKYEEVFEELKEKFGGQTIAEQTKNLYNGWLYCLKSLTERVGEGYPLFMRNNAWEDKSLSTALGSWAEIRHDTILYGKQSAAECGGNEPPTGIGYVEPNPEFFNRLLWLTTATRENLDARGLLQDSMRYKLERFEEMLVFLKTCAQKELNGEDLSPEEHYSLVTYGGTLEYLSSSIAESDDWYLIESDTDKNMAMIADVHTSGNGYLEEGVGTAAEMYVAIWQNGKVYLTRGAVFDYFEFESSERLTDEQWQAKLKESSPARPPFTGSYMDGEGGSEVPVPDAPYSSGC